MTHAPAISNESHDSGHAHGLKLMPFFLALLALTAAEVGLYEWWVRTGLDTVQKDPGANQDVEHDWTKDLAGDTIKSSTWTVEGITASSDKVAGGKTRVTLAGGTDGISYLLTNRIVTGKGDEKEHKIRVDVMKAVATAESLLKIIKEFAIPKFALVLLILIFTLPKAYIVLVYFMHLRFEKAIVVVLAVVPLLLVWICVLPTLNDGTVLKKQRWYHPEVIGLYHPDDHADHDHKDGKDSHGEKKPAPADPDADAFK